MSAAAPGRRGNRLPIPWKNMWPQLTPEFVNGLWLLVIDKVALGALIFGAGYLINRRLENTRFREAERKELLKRRLGAILEQWDAVRPFHFDAVNAWLSSQVSGRAAEGGGRLPHDVAEDARRLVGRHEALRLAIRDRRSLLGKTIANAMYGSIGADLDAARSLLAGELPQDFEYPNPDFDWLEQFLGKDLDPLEISSEEALSADREASRRKSKAKPSP